MPIKVYNIDDSVFMIPRGNCGFQVFNNLPAAQEPILSNYWTVGTHNDAPFSFIHLVKRAATGYPYGSMIYPTDPGKS